MFTILSNNLVVEFLENKILCFQAGHSQHETYNGKAVPVCATLNSVFLCDISEFIIYTVLGKNSSRLLSNGLL